MRCIIFGSREFNDYAALEKAVIDSGFKITSILNGKSKGAEACGQQYGKLHKIKVIDYAPEWDNLDAPNCKIKVNDYGKEYNSLSAWNRNQKMCDECDCAIGLQSINNNDTKDMEERLKKAGKLVFMVRPEVTDGRIEF